LTSNKLWEKRVINDLKSHFKAFPEGDIQPFEAPDFIINKGNKLVGIEVIEYIRGQTDSGSPKRHEEILQHQLAESAKSVFESKHRTCLWVSLQPSPHSKLANISKKERENIKSLLVETIEDNIPEDQKRSKHINIDWLHNKKLNRFIYSD